PYRLRPYHIRRAITGILPFEPAQAVGLAGKYGITISLFLILAARVNPCIPRGEESVVTESRAGGGSALGSPDQPSYMTDGFTAAAAGAPAPHATPTQRDRGPRCPSGARPRTGAPPVGRGCRRGRRATVRDLRARFGDRFDHRRQRQRGPPGSRDRWWQRP